MKSFIFFSLCSIALSLSASAFDPDGPPPKKTLAWTTSNLANVTIPNIDFDEAPVTFIAEYLSKRGMTKDHTVSIELKNLGETANKPITMKARNIRLLEVLGLVAEEIGAQLVISPGKVTLIK
ncbi:hypothetical protein ACFSW8_09830 [Rubritalea tangerina]|uniref:Uncharacterized protein n=1 Tax=Rubritalea tangerina TaxID=430798 RepID=A0ABW4ZCE7_9BACT